MKSIISKKVIVNIDLKLDSSEAIMLGKKGKFYAELDVEQIKEILCLDVNIEDYEMNISIQIEDMERYGFIKTEADKHRDEQIIQKLEKEADRKYADFSDLKVPPVRIL